VFDADGTTGSNTLNVNGLGAKTLYQYNSNGELVSAVINVGAIGAFVGIVEYFTEGSTGFVLLNPLPVQALTSVRQTVQGGPTTSAGLPNFLPASSANLTLTMQNVSASDPLTVSFAGGFGAGSDVMARSTSNLAFTCVNGTNYLYLEVGANGTLSTGTTLLPPVFQYGGTADTTNGQSTFDIIRMVMYVGNGSSAVVTNRVFVGEAVAAASAISAAIAYAYNGYFRGTEFQYLGLATANISHNIGAPAKSECVFVCDDAAGDLGYVENSEMDIWHYYATAYYGSICVLNPDNKSATITMQAALIFPRLDPVAGTPTGADETKWNIRPTIRRTF
jgi:hypothetical protein